MQLIQALRFHRTCVFAFVFSACFCSYAQQTPISPTTGAGDVNTTVSPTVTPAGTTFDIIGGTRPGNGSNLFHSFEQFSVPAGDTANFCNDCNGNSMQGIQNILSRVTGRTPSDIFGTIKTTGFPGADLYLLNPAGVLFGPGASVDVAGSFYVSTADFLEFGNGARFNATDSPVSPQLAVAPPEAFGFLSNNQGKIEVRNDVRNPRLDVNLNPGETFALVGGPVDILQGGVIARSASVNIVSSGGGGIARIQDDGNVQLEEQEPGGPITIQRTQISARGITVDGKQIELTSTMMRTAGDAEGQASDIQILGGEIQLINTTISTPGGTAEQAADIVIAAENTVGLNGARLLTSNDELQSGDVSISANRGVTLDGSLILTSTDSGQAGDVSFSVTEGNLTIRNSSIDAEAPFGTSASIDLSAKNGSITLSEGTEIFSRTFAAAAGDVTIVARAVTMDNGARIEGFTLGSGQSANVRIEAAEQVSLSGEGTLITTASGDPAEIEQPASGRGGDITINAAHLEVRDGAEINANANSIGPGGDIAVNAPEGEVAVTGVGSAITTASLGTGQNAGIAGSAGEIMIKAGRFVASDGGAISVDTLGPGAGGNVAIESPDIRLSSGGTISARTSGSGGGGNIEINEIHGKSGTVSLSGASTSISSETTGEGDAGSVAIKTGRLTVRDGAAISASTSGNGKGGSVNIEATNIELLNGGAIAARSESTNDRAESGSLSIRADDTIRIFNGSSIDVKTQQARAGDIALNAGFLLHLRENSSVSTSARDGAGDGGDIIIDPVFTILDQGSRITAEAFRGRGGNIRISTDFLFAPPESISASSDFGVSGNVEIDSPDSDVISGALELPGSFLDAASLLSDRCSARTAEGASSFIVSGRGGVPPGPETVLPSYRDLSLSEPPKLNHGATAISEDQMCNR